MRLALRILGTWLIALAMVLLVIDGTKSLAANTVLFAQFGQVWTGLHAPSLETVHSFLGSRFFADLLGRLFEAILTYPAFAVVGVPGIVLALLGRKPRREHFLRQSEI